MSRSPSSEHDRRKPKDPKGHVSKSEKNVKEDIADLSDLSSLSSMSEDADKYPKCAQMKKRRNDERMKKYRARFKKFPAAAYLKSLSRANRDRVLDRL